MKNITKILVTALSMLIFTASATQGPPKEELKDRYDRLISKMPDNSVFLLLSGENKNKSNDVNYPFRQTNEIQYYTGSNIPETSFAIVKSGDEISRIIFAQKPNLQYETWEGRLPSFEDIKARTGVDSVSDAEQFDRFLSSLFNGWGWGGKRFDSFKSAFDNGEASVLLNLGRRSFTTKSETQESELAKKLKDTYQELTIRNFTQVLNDFREIKSEWELAQLQKAIDITGEAQKAAMKRVKTAEYENQIQATIEFTFRDKGGCCWGFPSIIGTGDNATILHYVENNAKIKRNELFLADIGAEVNFYSADVTRTFPASGKFTKHQKEIYQAVLESQQAAIDLIAPGVEYSTISTKAWKVLGEHLLKIGLISEVTFPQVRMYFLHGLSHGLGMDVHDPWNRTKAFRENVVITVEPGLYIRKKDVLKNRVFLALSPEVQEKIKAKLDIYDGIGVRIEDDIVVTKDGHRNMSIASPRTIADVEAFMKN